MEIAIGILVLLLIILWHPIMTNLEKLTDWLAEKRRGNLRVLLDKNEYEDRMQDNVKGLKEYQKKRQVCKEQTAGTDHDSDFLQVLTSSDENIKQEKINQERDNMESNLRTKSYFLLILKKIGCAYEINEEDSILFTWQGGHFMADATEDCPFVVI